MTTIGFTGGTGFIGRRLVHYFAEHLSDIRLILFTEPRFLSQGEQLATKLRARLPHCNIEVVPSDITKPDLDLSPVKRGCLRDELDSIIHLAANYDLSVPKRLAWKINVEGTSNILSLIKGCHTNLIYFSTCYVAGNRVGVIRENELDESQGFKNYYEETKFFAEKRVREAMDLGDISALILRPSIVCGHSQTGATEKFDGIYFVMELISGFRGFPFPLARAGKLEAPANVIPVDFLVEVTFRLWEERRTLFGKTIHLADPEPMRSREVFDVLCQLILGRKNFGRIPVWAVKAILKVIRGRSKATKIPVEILDYFNHDSRFECLELTRAMERWKIQFPDIRRVLPKLHAYWKAPRKSESDRPEFHKASYDETFSGISANPPF